MVSPFVSGAADFFQTEAQTSTINYPLSSAVLNVLPAIEQTLLTFEVPAMRSYTLKEGCATGNGLGRFQLWRDGVLLFQGRTSYFERAVSFPTGLVFSSGQILQIKVCNATISGEINDYEAFLFMREELT